MRRHITLGIALVLVAITLFFVWSSDGGAPAQNGGGNQAGQSSAPPPVEEEQDPNRLRDEFNQRAAFEKWYHDIRDVNIDKSTVRIDIAAHNHAPPTPADFMTICGRALAAAVAAEVRFTDLVVNMVTTPTARAKNGDADCTAV